MSTNGYISKEARERFAYRRAAVDAELIAAALERADWDDQCGLYGDGEPVDRLARAARAYRLEHAGEAI